MDTVVPAAEAETLHDQTELLPGSGVLVDCGVAPLLRALAARGLETQFSCQGGSGRSAYLVFSASSSWDCLKRAVEALLGADRGASCGLTDEQAVAGTSLVMALVTRWHSGLPAEQWRVETERVHDWERIGWSREAAEAMGGRVTLRWPGEWTTALAELVELLPLEV